MPNQIAWLNARPYCWAASTDGGRTFSNLDADDDEYSPEAIEEAARKFGVPPNEWELLDEPIITLTPEKS